MVSGPPHTSTTHPWSSHNLQPSCTASLLSSDGYSIPLEGLAALVVKPSLVGSWEAVQRLSGWVGELQDGGSSQPPFPQVTETSYCYLVS